VILRADKAAVQKNWSRAVKYGEQALKGSQALDKYGDARYINLLKSLNSYYDKSNRLKEVGPRIKEAYILSQKYLGPDHKTTITCRLLYYKLLISLGKYHKAIPLVQESITVLEESKKDEFRLLHYLNQLYSLYGLTKQYNKEERTLIRLLKLNKHLLGSDIKENIKIIQSLARTFCLEKKTLEFDKLMEIYNLDYEC